jgi:dTDP-4-dehydrorhamnose reductase
MKILVFGSNGQLGKCLQDVDFGKDHSVVFSIKDDVNVEEISELKDTLTKIRPNILINASGYTAVDKAETEIKKANNINHIAVKNMANMCKQIDCILIHVSTDYVFDGSAKTPYVEEDLTNPKSIYGMSKLNGEEAIIDSSCKYFIVRTSWVYSEYGNNFLKTMLKIGKNLDNINIVSDEIGCPTYAQDVALCISAIVKHSSSKDIPYGIYHFTGNQICSWYDFANIIFKKAKNIGIITPKNITPIQSSKYLTAAKRPQYSVLDSSKFINTFGYSASKLEVSIAKVLDKIYV